VTDRCRGLVADLGKDAIVNLAQEIRGRGEDHIWIPIRNIEGKQVIWNDEKITLDEALSVFA